jgi:hypothetical protein
MPFDMLKSWNDSSTVIAIGTTITPTNSSTAGPLSSQGVNCRRCGAARALTKLPVERPCLRRAT